MRDDGPYWRASSGPGGGRRILIQERIDEYYNAGKTRLLDPTTGSVNLIRDLEAARQVQVDKKRMRDDPRSPQFGQPMGPEAPGRRSPVREAVGGAIKGLIPGIGR